MDIETIYKVISGSAPEIERILNVLAKDDWRPVTMSCFGQPSVLTVVLENKIMEEGKLNLTGAIVEDSGQEPAEEI